MFGRPRESTSKPDEPWIGAKDAKLNDVRIRIAVAAVQAGNQGSPREIEAFATQLAELLVPPA